jgi:hypothetical protein
MVDGLITFEGTAEEIAEQLLRWKGRRVRLSILPDGTGSEPSDDQRSLEEKIAAIMADVPDEEWAKLPTDLSDNLDHYIYGTSTRK